MTWLTVNFEGACCPVFKVQPIHPVLDPEDGGSKLFQHNKIMLNLQQGTALDPSLQIISVQCQFSTSES